MADVFSVLKVDHTEVEALLTSLTHHADGSAGPDAERLVIEESRHEAAEEMYFWPAVRALLPGGAALAEEALRQENEGKQVLDDLRKASPGDERFAQLVVAFAKAARAHIAFEEQQVWPALQQVITAEKSEDLGRMITKAKEMGPTRPHPHGPDSPGSLKTVGAVAAVTDKIRDAATGRSAES